MMQNQPMKKTILMKQAFLKKIVYGMFILLLGLPTVAVAKMLDNLSILVPSCDKYEEVWDPFFKLLFKYWPNLEQNIYLISNHKIYPDKRVIPIMIGDEKSWSDNVLHALEKIPDDYVMIIMDDYFFVSPVAEAKIIELFEIVQTEKAGYLQLREASKEQTVVAHPNLKDLGYFTKNSEYRNALQVAIWNKKTLKELLVSGESPWEFEMQGSIRSSSIDKPFMCVLSNCPVSYFGAVEKGYWSPTAIEFLNKENIPVKITMPVSGKMRSFLRGPVRSFLSENFVQPVRRLLKNVNT